MVAPVPAHISQLPRRKLSSPSRRSGPNSCRLILLQTLLHYQRRQPLWNQANPNSFAKTPSVGVPLRQLSALCASALYFSAAFARPSRRFSCPPLTTFRMNTCKSISKQSTLTIFRMNTYAKQGEGGGGRRSHFSPRPFERSTPRIQPGGSVRGAGPRRRTGRRIGQARRCLLSSSPLRSMDALRPPRPVLPLSSDAHRATRRGFGWPPGSSDAYSELFNSAHGRPYSQLCVLCASVVSPILVLFTAGGPSASARRPPACHLPDPPRTRWRLRLKTPSAAHRSRRNSCRRSAPS